MLNDNLDEMRSFADQDKCHQDYQFLSGLIFFIAD